MQCLTERTPCRKLSERAPTANVDVGVGEGGGWEEDRGSGWKLDDALKIPQHEVPSYRGVKFTQCSDTAPPKGQPVQLLCACFRMLKVVWKLMQRPGGVLLCVTELGNAAYLLASPKGESCAKGKEFALRCSFIFFGKRHQRLAD